MQTGPLVENFVTNHVHAFVAAHVIAICTVVGLWVFVGSILARYWPMPPADAPKWKRLAHFVFVNWPEFGAGLEGKTWMGIPFSLPFISWTRRANEIVDVVEKAREILNEPAAVAVATTTTTTQTVAVTVPVDAKPESGPPSVIVPDPPKPAAPATDTVPAAVTPPKSDKAGFVSLGLLLAIALIGFIIALACSGCAPTDAYVTALKVKGDLADTLYYAHEAWMVFDEAYHAGLVKDAGTLADGHAKLEKWEMNEKKVDDAFIIARKAIETYSLALQATDAEQKKDFVTAIADVSAAVANLVDILRSLGVTIPGIDSVQKPTTVAYKSPLLAQLQSRMRDLVAAARDEKYRVSKMFVAVCTERHIAPYYPQRICNYFQNEVSR